MDDPSKKLGLDLDLKVHLKLRRRVFMPYLMLCFLLCIALINSSPFWQFVDRFFAGTG